MPETPKPAATTPDSLPSASNNLWEGTGRCPEAQGDGVPCRGTDGECDACGRALPVPPQTVDLAR